MGVSCDPVECFGECVVCVSLGGDGQTIGRSVQDVSPPSLWGKCGNT